jgi:phosphotriesterase-related protein
MWERDGYDENMSCVSRRCFVQAVLPLAASGAWAASQEAASDSANGRVMTVRGPVHAAELGLTLVHEHVLVDFVGADQVSADRYERDDAFRRALPHLRSVQSLGVRTLVECTPAYLGRDPQLLLRLAQATGLHILTNTGYYGAANDRFVPAHAFRETARQLADRWTTEWRQGIDGTEVQPGFMKIGVDAGHLSTIDRKLVDAAALTHQATGLAIASHTGDGIAAHQQLDVLEAHGVAADAFIWVHAQNEQDIALVRRGARRGAWISLDGISASSAARHLAAVLALAEDDLLGRVLLSHDAGWYRVGEPDGGEYRPHDAMFEHVLPALRERLGEEAITTILVDNAARALSLRE